MRCGSWRSAHLFSANENQSKFHLEVVISRALTHKANARYICNATKPITRKIQFPHLEDVGEIGSFLRLGYYSTPPNKLLWTDYFVKGVIF